MNSGPEIVSQYFPGLTGQQQDRFKELLPVYKTWNEKINVISRKDIDQLYPHHVLHSLGIAKVVDFADGSRVLDAGTGGGFPGIPLAILYPGIRFHLVDSIGKKITVVKEVVRALSLENVTTEKGRVEELNGHYDYVVSRAVAPLAEMIRWLKPRIRKGKAGSLANGMFFLKGGELDQEISETGMRFQIFDLHNFFSEEFFKEKKVLYLPVA